MHENIFLSASMDNVDVVVEKVWNELVEASLVEPPLNVKPYYDDVTKKRRTCRQQAVCGLKDSIGDVGQGVPESSSKTQKAIGAAT
jgi:hypothetical protein